MTILYTIVACGYTIIIPNSSIYWNYSRAEMIIAMIYNVKVDEWREGRTPKTPKGKRRHLMATTDVWGMTASCIWCKLPNMYSMTCEHRVTWPNLTYNTSKRKYFIFIFNLNFDPMRWFNICTRIFQNQYLWGFFIINLMSEFIWTFIASLSARYF